jgi:hypothetical protein
MNCDELLPHLPLLALDESDAALDGALSEHLRGCERCRARLEALQATRHALDAATVEDIAPLDGASLRAANPRTILEVAPRRRFAPRFAPWSAAAAAALLVLAAGAGFLGGRVAGAAEARQAEEGIPRAALAHAIVTLDARLASLEERHDHDLFTLAQAVDRQQLIGDQRVTERIDELAAATRAQLGVTRGAIDDLAQWIRPAVDFPLEREH